ncbi:MAG: hypothetical protein JSW40_01815 [Candidatus Omnitrophota bacterium]|nr:MAG: hypothetical protein JSW40_01815 [Candidatus Omnitrophota bacterium]
MVFEKGILATAGVVAGAVFVSFVGYKILKKKSPTVVKKVKTSIADTKKRMSKIADSAKESFREGYAQA